MTSKIKKKQYAQKTISVNGGEDTESVREEQEKQLQQSVTDRELRVHMLGSFKPGLNNSGLSTKAAFTLLVISVPRRCRV